MLRAGWLVVVGVIACKEERPAAPAATPVSPASAVVTSDAPAAVPCLADRVGKLQPRWTTHPECVFDPALCSRGCDGGDASMCFAAASIHETAGRDSEAYELFGRACLSGLSLGCVNVGAQLWLVEGSESSAACARRLFQQACDVGDSFGCAMVGRMLVEEGTTETRAQARSYFEAMCKSMKGPPCRMLAWYLERGELGDYPPALLKQLMTDACDGGDAVACGPWTRVDDVFNQ